MAKPRKSTFLYFLILHTTHSLNPSLPMGVYGTSTWYQGVDPTPDPHPAPSSSNCKPLPTVSVSPALRRRNNMVKRHALPAFPGATPAPVV